MLFLLYEFVFKVLVLDQFFIVCDWLRTQIVMCASTEFGFRLLLQQRLLFCKTVDVVILFHDLAVGHLRQHLSFTCQLVFFLEHGVDLFLNLQMLILFLIDGLFLAV